MAAGGWLGTAMPAELGGAGLGLTEAALLSMGAPVGGSGVAAAAAAIGQAL